MWVLETEGDALKGKKLWLRPGKKFLFGRTQTEAGRFAINDKTISRRHLTVEVGVVGPDDCANPKTRSQVTLVDLDTKIGTVVNGDQIRGQTRVLERDRNSVTLGKHKHPFIFTWVPITLTFSFSLKEAKADPYTALYKRLGPLDIKVLVEYQRGLTTHLVAKKRNTPKGLQALIDGKYIVHNDSFINAIVAATTPVPSSEEDGIAKSPLEEDWVQNFPDPLRYLPPRGEEPTERDETAYAPNPDRQNVFDGYSFIFYEKRQFDILFAPITEGCGKAYFREVIPDETEVDDFVRYVKQVAGEKGLGEFEDGSEGKGVVVVRFNPVKGPGSEWFSDFNRQVALKLDHRLIEQNEFLDAILGNDASVLRRPLELEPSETMPPPPSHAIATTSQTPQISQPAPTPTPAQEAPPEPARRGRSRRTVTTRFKGFDDDDENKFSAPVNLNSIPEYTTVDQPPAEESQSQGLFVSQDPEMVIDQEEPQPEATQTRSGRKRITPPMDYEEEDEDIMEQLAPAAAALKKRRLADDAERHRRGESTPPAQVIEEKPIPKPEPPKIKKEVDILEVARRQREKAEELAKAEREALEKAMDGMDIEAIRNLAIVEEMEVTRPPPPVRAAHADESDRWDDRWNGRKNFKKFRRRGEEGGSVRSFHRVIVPLEEVKKKDFGIGDDYWLEGDAERKKKKGKSRETPDTSQSQSQARAKDRATTRATEILASEAEEEMAQEVEAHELSSDLEVLEQPPKSVTSAVSQRSQTLVDKTSTPQSVSTGTKRPAPTNLTKPAPAKKARQTALTRKEESDDSDDELKFRFRKRR